MPSDRMHIEVEPDHWAPIPESLIFDVRVSGNAKVLWAALRRYGQEPSNCHPSVGTLAKRLNVTSRSIRRWCEELEGAGWLTRIERFEDGRQIPNGYVVRRTPTSGGEDSVVRGGGTEGSSSGRTEESGGEREPEEREPYNESGSQGDATPVVAVESDPFDVFWRVYPRRDDKADARRAWAKAIRKVDSPNLIIAGAARYRDDPNREAEYTKHAATWLNKESWNNGPLPRRTNGKSSTVDWMRRSLMNDQQKEHTNGDDGSDHPRSGQAQRALPRGQDA